MKLNEVRKIMISEETDSKLIRARNMAGILADARDYCGDIGLQANPVYEHIKSAIKEVDDLIRKLKTETKNG